MSAPQEVLELVERFASHLDAYKSGSYNETQLRREFLDPFFKLLGWDIDNQAGYAEAYKDVIHEDALRSAAAQRLGTPDYCFRIGGTRKFFLEAKKPAIFIKEEITAAFQLRSYSRRFQPQNRRARCRIPRRHGRTRRIFSRRKKKLSLTRRTRTTKKSKRTMKTRAQPVELRTSISPHSIAAAVVEEAGAWLGTPLPRHWVRELADRATTVYSLNSQFRRLTRVSGNAGRDRLWAFTRHWLCALIAQHRPDLHQRLPSSYNVGYDLPPQNTRMTKPKARSRVTQSWAAAAHFHALI